MERKPPDEERSRTGEPPWTGGAKLVTPSEHERAFYGQEAQVACPSDENELVDIVREACANRRPLVPAGTGCHAYLGNPPPPGSLVVSLRDMRRVLQHEPGDFTVSVGAGTPLPEIREALLNHGQELSGDAAPGRGGSAGGWISAAEPGPRTGSRGPTRSALLGARCILGDGRVHSTGGRVVKNVSGYDLGKLLVGALGTAGILLELHLRLRSLPGLQTAAVASFRTGGAAWRFLRALREANLEPAALVSLAGESAGVPVREPLPQVFDTPEGSRCIVCLLEGLPERVRFQEEAVERLLRETVPETCVWLRQAEEVEALLDLICGLAAPSPQPETDLGIVRLVTLVADAPRVEEEVLAALGSRSDREVRTACDALTGVITVRWKAGGDPGADRRSVDEPLVPLRQVAEGHAARGVLVYLPQEVRRGHEYLLRPDPAMKLAGRFLQVLDPAGILSPGRICGRRAGSPPEEET